jgi:hypothetical protein
MTTLSVDNKKRVILRQATPGDCYMGIPMERAREALRIFRRERHADWIADDLAALASKAEHSEQVTDHYLADLAAKHGHKLATLDAGIKHASAELVS